MAIPPEEQQVAVNVPPASTRVLTKEEREELYAAGEGLRYPFEAKSVDEEQKPG